MLFQDISPEKILNFLKKICILGSMSTFLDQFCFCLYFTHFLSLFLKSEYFP